VSAEASLEFGVLVREIFFKAHETVPGKRLAGLGMFARCGKVP